MHWVVAECSNSLSVIPEPNMEYQAVSVCTIHYRTFWHSLVLKEMEAAIGCVGSFKGTSGGVREMILGTAITGAYALG